MKRTQSFLAATLLATNLLIAQGTDDSGISRPYLPPAPTPAEQAGPMQAGSNLPSMRTPIHTAESDMGIAYGTWAAGDDYKASFHDGMTFIPYLGVDYPVTQSLGWQTQSVMLGANELLHNPAVPTAQGSWRYEYRYDAITEAYDVRHEGLEQTFVLRSKPANGDLVICGQVTTQLRAENVAPALQSLTFYDDAQRAIIKYGQAIAFDAVGNRVDVATSYNNGAITLTVPASWMEQAVLPITVDPLLTRVMTTTGLAAVDSLDIGRDDQATIDTVMITYTRAVSATDSDLWARLRTDDFNITAWVFTDITSNWKTDGTSCAFVGGASRWAIVMRRYFYNAATRTSLLRCHVHDSGDMTLQTNVGQLNSPAGLNDWRPDIGGVQAFMSGSNAMVVFQREDNTINNNHFANVDYSSVYGCLLDVTTTNGTFGTPFEVKPTNIHDCERPSINQVASGGSSFSWVCMQQRIRDDVPGDDWDLQGARIGHDGTVASGSWFSDLATVSPWVHQLGPQIEGSNGRYAVVFSTVDVASVNYKTSLISGKQLIIERFDWANGASLPTGNFASTAIRSSTDRRWESVGIGFDTNDDSHWACAFRSVPPGAGAMYYTRVGYNGKPTEGLSGAVLYSVSGDEAGVGSCVFDNDHNTFQFSYAVAEAGSSNPVYGHTLTYETPTAPSTFGTSCGSATLSWLGNQQIGAEFDRVRVTAAPPSSIHIMLAATVTTNVPVLHPIVFPGCRLLVMASGPGYLGAFPTAIGSNPSWQLSLPEYLGAQTLHFQDWYLDGNGLLYSSERLTVPIIK